MFLLENWLAIVITSCRISVASMYRHKWCIVWMMSRYPTLTIILYWWPSWTMCSDFLYTCNLMIVISSFTRHCSHYVSSSSWSVSLSNYNVSWVSGLKLRRLFDRLSKVHIFPHYSSICSIRTCNSRRKEFGNFLVAQLLMAVTSSLLSYQQEKNCNVTSNYYIAPSMSPVNVSYNYYIAPSM